MKRLALLFSLVLLSLASLAGTASAALLFNGNSLAKFAVSGETGTVTEVTDPLGSGKTVFKNLVTDSNLLPFGNPRAQQASTSIIDKGDEFWLKTKVMVPSSFPKSIPNGDSLVSIYGPPHEGPAPWELATYGEDLSWQRNGTYGWDIPWEMSLPRDKWVSIVLHQRFEEAGKGWVEMWVDGEQVTFFDPASSWNPNEHAEATKLVMATMDESNDGGSNNVRLLQSRTKGDAATATVYFGSLKLGDTRDDVSDPTFVGKKITDFSSNQSASGAVTEVSDPLGSGQTVLQMTVDDEDVFPVTPTENPRAQLVGPSNLGKGDEFWLGTKLLIPASFPSVPSWMSLVSIYGPPFEGTGPWQLEVFNDELGWQRNGTYGWDVPYTVPLEKGKWTRLLLHMRLDEEGKGWVEMWIDGERLTFFEPATSWNPNEIAPTNHLMMSTLDESNNAAANSLRISQYRELGMFEIGTLYFGPTRVGEERADVDF